MAPVTALESIQNKFIIIKNSNGDVYWPDFGIDNIINMQPGQGYYICMNEDGELVYP